MGEGEWLEVSVRVGGEAAEAAAEVFSRYIEEGVVIEREATKFDEYKVIAYIPKDEQLAERKEKIEQGLWHLGQMATIPAPEFREVPQQNWMEAWKEHFQPLEIGEKFQVLPAWRAGEKSETREVILIEPGMGFGTGTHPTTQLSMMLIERHLKPGMGFGTGTHPTTQLSMMLIERYLKPGASMIDVGSGSGILSVAGVRLGANQVLAVDVDAEAVRAADDTIRRNHAEGKIELKQGSVAEILRGEFSLRKAEITAANILARILLELIEEGLTELVADGGTLILSGILDENEAAILSALRERKFEVIERIQYGDWVALAAEGIDRRKHQSGR